ncbi:uncharacterized protein LOC128251557, partial [Octopus bimaculoides]|uniref:uncharacterized protein LOC128251557 n=1 Tax=Octopus bimaculoides TaxID=37653 RepID=UPI0022E22B59
MMTMSRNKMILLLTLITWCCNNLQVKSDLFIRSYNAHRTQFDAFVYNSLEDVNEEKPHLVTPCETVVNRSDDKSRYPKYVYHGRCKSLGGQCGQSTKKVHMLVPGNASALKSEYRDDFVPYTIEVVTINTTCVQRRPDKLLQTETKIH